MMRTRCLAVLCLVLLSSPAAAEKISGTVVDGKGKAIEGAEVTSVDAVQPRYTASSGEFVMELRPTAKSPVRVTVRKGGYETFTYYIDIPQTVPRKIPLQGGHPPPVAPKASTPRPPTAPQKPPSVLELELKSTDAAKRVNALKVLATKGKEALPAASAIAEAVRDAEPSVRMQAVLTLGALRPRDPEIKDVLLLAMRSKDIGCLAAQVLGSIEKPDAMVTPLNAVAGDKQVPIGVRMCAATMSVDITGEISTEAAEPIALALLDDNSTGLDLALRSEASIRRFAYGLAIVAGRRTLPLDTFVRVLEVIAVADEMTLTSFAYQLTTKAHYEVLADYAEADARLSPAARPLLRNAFVRWKELIVPCDYGPPSDYVRFIDGAEKLGVFNSEDAVTALLLQSKWMNCTDFGEPDADKTREARQAIHLAIRRRGDAASVPLRKVFGQTDRPDHVWIAATIYMLTRGADAEATEVLLEQSRADYPTSEVLDPIPLFAEVLPLRHDGVINALASAAEAGNEAAALALFRGLESAGGWERVAVRLLPSVKPAIVEIGAALLKRLPQLAPATVAKLVEANGKSESWMIRNVLIKHAASAVPAITALLRTPRQSDAIKALESMGATAAPAVDALVAIVKSRRAANRAAAARALGAIGSGAAAAVPALRDASKEKDEVLRTEALAALVKIAKL
jgi:hypothetical protein